MNNFSEMVSFIWGVADLLRGPYKPAQYGKVILPLTVLRRLDCVLKPTKAKVLAKAKALKGGKVGNIDILSASQGSDKIAWYENDGGSPPTFTERVISTTADGAFSVFATDLDGDGDTDVVSASFHDDKIAWYENLSPCGFDSDCDGDVDLDDFAQFQAAFAGP